MIFFRGTLRSATISRACSGAPSFRVFRYQQVAVRLPTTPSASPSSLHNYSATAFNKGSSRTVVRRAHYTGTSRSASTTSATDAAGGGLQGIGGKRGANAAAAGAATASAGKHGGVTVSGSKPVAAWLFGTAGAVAVMVTVGGITRMTKSGLSMTDWKVQGSLPPTTEVIDCSVVQWSTRSRIVSLPSSRGESTDAQEAGCSDTNSTTVAIINMNKHTPATYMCP